MLRLELASYSGRPEFTELANGYLEQRTAKQGNESGGKLEYDARDKSSKASTWLGISIPTSQKGLTRNS